MILFLLNVFLFIIINKIFFEGEMDANRPVPFRLTHNISELITSVGVNGPLTASMIATARCLIQPNFKVPSILRAILRDETLAWYKKVIKNIYFC